MLEHVSLPDVNYSDPHCQVLPEFDIVGELKTGRKSALKRTNIDSFHVETADICALWDGKHVRQQHPQIAGKSIVKTTKSLM